MSSLEQDSEPLIGVPGDRLVDTLHNTLVEAILDGRIGANGRLYPGEIASLFGVSSTPVREALMRLAAEGFVQAVPRRGFHLTDPTESEIRDLWQVRRGLEVLAAELAIDRLNTGEVTLDALIDIEQRLAAGGTERTVLRDHIDLNALFHETIVEMAGNAILATLFGGLRMRLLGMWIKNGHEAWQRRIKGDHAEHRAIVAALEARDQNAARVAVSRHIERSLVDMLADLEARVISQRDANKSESTRRK
jgi:DNA-binding GntR family transcriptional regulator